VLSLRRDELREREKEIEELKKQLKDKEEIYKKDEEEKKIEKKRKREADAKDKEEIKKKKKYEDRIRRCTETLDNAGILFTGTSWRDLLPHSSNKKEEVFDTTVMFRVYHVFSLCVWYIYRLRLSYVTSKRRMS